MTRHRVDAKDHQRPADGGGHCQPLEVSIERRLGGSQGEPGEAEQDQAHARPDDHAVHEGLEMPVPRRSQSHKSTNRGAEQGHPYRARPAEEEGPSRNQGADHPQTQKVLRTPEHQPDRNTNMRC